MGGLQRKSGAADWTAMVSQLLHSELFCNRHTPQYPIPQRRSVSPSLDSVWARDVGKPSGLSPTFARTAVLGRGCKIIFVYSGMRSWRTVHSGQNTQRAEIHTGTIRTAGQRRRAARFLRYSAFSVSLQLLQYRTETRPHQQDRKRPTPATPTVGADPEP